MTRVRRLEGITRALIERLGMDDDHFTERGLRLVHIARSARNRTSNLLERTPEAHAEYATLSDLDQQLGFLISAYEIRTRYAGQVSVNRKFHRMLRDVAQRTVPFTEHTAERHEELQNDVRGREREIAYNHEFFNAFMSTYHAAKDAYRERQLAAFDLARNALGIAKKLRWDHKYHARELDRAKDALEYHDERLEQLRDEQTRAPKDALGACIADIECSRIGIQGTIARLTPIVEAKRFYADKSFEFLDDLKNSNLL